MNEAKKPDKKAKKKDKKKSKKKKKKTRKENDKKKKDKKKKKQKKEKKSSAAAAPAAGDQYGKYGILTEDNFFTKQDEFQVWLLEVRHSSLEHTNKREQKELEAAFMEDYNTCTMPSVKYYDLQAWERNAARQKNLFSNMHNAGQVKKLMLTYGCFFLILGLHWSLEFYTNIISTRTCKNRSKYYVV